MEKSNPEKAKVQLSKRQTDIKLPFSEVDLLKTVYELQVHPVVSGQQKEDLLTANEQEESAGEKLASLFDFAPTACFILDNSGIILNLNFAAAKMLGKEREKLINSNFDFFLTRETTDTFADFFKILLKGENPGSCDLAFGGAGEIPVHAQLNGRVANDGEQYLITARDISERKKSEEVILKDQKIFRFLSELMNDFVFELSLQEDGSYKMSKITGSYEGATGRPSGEINSLADFYGIVLPEDQKVLQNSFNRLFSDKKPVTFNCRSYARDGSLQWMEVTLAPETDEKTGWVPSIYGKVKNITEQKNADDTLRKSEEKFRIVADNAFNWEFWEGAEGQPLHHSPSCEKVTGYTADEFLYDRDLLIKIIHPDDRQTFIDHRRDVRANKIPGRCFFRIITRNGEIRFIEHLCKEVYDHSHSYIGHRGSNIDITERIHYENQLKESEIQYRNLANSGSALIWTSGTDKLCNYFNETWLKFTGRTLEQELGNGWAEGVHPDDFQHCLDIYITSFDRKEPFEMEYRLKYHDGSYRWITDLGTPRYDINGNFSGYLGYCYDVDSKKKTEKSLQLTQFAIDHLHDPVYWMDSDGKFIYVNKASCESLGYTREELLNMSVADIDPVYPMETWEENWQKLRVQKKKVVESVHKTKDGQTYPVEIHDNYIVIDGREYNYAFAKNITERKKAEAILKENQDLLSRSQQIAHVGSWSLDLKTSHVTWTDEVYRIFGYGPQEFPVTLDVFYNALPPDDRRRVSDAFSGSLKTGSEGFEIEHRIIHNKTGDIRHVYERYVHERDQEGVVFRTVGMIQDITDQKTALDEIHWRNEDLQLMNAINRAANNDAELGSIIDLIGDQLGKTYESLLLSVYLPDEDNHRLRMYGSKLSNELVQRIEKLIGNTIPQISFKSDGEHPFTLLEGRTKGLIFTGRKEVTKRLEGYLKGTPWPVFFQKVVKKLLPAIVDLIEYHSTAAVPMISNGKIVGYLEFGSRNILTEADLNRIQSVADQFAAIIVRYESEKKLRKSEERFASAFNFAAIGMAFVAPDGRWLKVNPVIPAMLGYTETELLSLNFQDITHPDDLARDLEYVRQLLAGVIKTYQMEKRYFHKSGNIIWVLLSVSLVHDHEGKPLHFISQIQDITEQKLAEDTIRESERRFRALYTNMMQGVVYQDGTGVIIHANPAAERILGLSLSQMQGRTSVDPRWHTIHEDGTPFPGESHPTMIALASGKENSAVMGVFNPSEERYRWIIVNAIPVFRNGEHKPYQVFATFEDITELKNAFDQLNEAKEVLEFKVEERTRELKEINTFQKAILDNAPIGIITTDHTGIVQSVNPAFESMTGYSAGEVIGKTTPLHFHKREEIFRYCSEKTGNFAPRGEEVFASAVEDMLNRTTEWHWVTKDGREYPVKIILSPLVNNDGKVTGTMGLVMNVSSEKEYLDSLRKSEAENRAILQAVPDLMFRIHRDGTYLDSHSKIESSLYVPRELFMGKKIGEVLPPDLASQSVQTMEKAFLTGNVEQYEYMLPAGNEEHYFENRIIAISEDEVLSMIRDITDRKKAETDLQQALQKLSIFIQNLHAGTLFENEQRQITLVNQSFCDLLKIPATPDQLVGSDCVLASEETKYAMKDPEGFIRKINEVISTGEIVLNDELYLKDGRVFLRDYIPIRHNNHLLGHLWQYRDVTENKRASEFESELLQLSLQLTGIPTSEIAPAIDLALLKSGSFLGADRAYIFEINAEKNTMTNTYEWCNKGISSEIENLKNLPCNFFPNWMGLLNRQENVIIPSVKDLPDTWKAEREIFERQGIRSILVIPLMLDNRLIGFVGLDSVRDKKEYNESEINILKVWGNMLAGLINHQRKESYIELMRQNYETFFNTIDDFLFVLDEHGNIIHTNTTVTRRLGYDTPELMGKPVLMVHPASRREEAGRIVGEMLAGTSEFCPVPLITRSGNYIPVETRVKHGFWDGKPVIFGVSKDISKMELSEEKFSKAFQSNAALMAISTLDGVFLDVNNTFVQKLGYSRDEVIGKTSGNLGFFENPEFRPVLTGSLIRNIAIRDIELRVRTKSGGSITGLFSGDLITIGEEKCLLTMMVDISDRKLAEAEILKAKGDAEKANQAKSEFLSRMSHELRTPMNSILGFAQLLDMGELNPKQKKGVTHILNNGKHLLNLINEVLDMSGIEAGRQVLNLVPVQIAPLLKEITDTIQVAADKRKITIHIEDSSYTGLFVLSDRLRLRQVLINLLQNAVKYNKDGGSIIIQAAPGPESGQGNTRMRILITDTGHGIQSEDISRLFQPFERLGAGKTTTEGTGLGLMIVKKLTEAMGGTVGVESEPGIGSTFWIELPLSENRNDKTLLTPGSPPHELPVSQKTSTLLYIEDNLSNIELVEDILTEHHPEVHLLTSIYGKQTFELAIAHKPGLIMLDLDLPDIQGLEVLRQLLSDERTKTIPVIIISADAMPFQVEKLMKAGAADYLTKPLDIVRFLKTIEEHTIM